MCDGRRKNIQRLPTLLIFMVGLSFAILACGCVTARYALADDGSGGGSFDYGVVYGPNSAAGLSDSDNPRYLVQVYAPNKYDAALIALGYNPTSSSFTDDARAYLSNQSTGGAFYDFAQLFSNNNTDWGEEITTNPSLTPGINFDVSNMETALRLNNSIYGADNVWSAEYTTTQRVAAVAAVGLVLSGSAGGGSGGSGGTVGDSLVFTDNVRYENSASSSNKLTGTDNVTYTFSLGSVTEYGYVLMPTPLSVNVALSDSLRDVVANYPTTQYNYYLMWRYGSTTYCYILIYDKNDVVEERVTLTTGPYRGDNLLYRLTSQSHYYLSGSNVTYTFDGSAVTISAGWSALRTSTSTESVSNNSGVQMFAFGSGAPVVPPTNWPDTPESPTVDPPSVPQPPTDEPIQQPTDTPIQPPNVWTPITSPTDPTFTVDLQGILDAMATHCQHIRDNLDGNFAQLYNNMTDYWSRKYTNFKQFLDGQFGYIGDTIVDETKDLMDYLEDLFEWLAEQFDFSVSGTGYNDNTVVSWLRKIYARLGGGTTIRPPDPVVDPKGTGDWLSQLLENLVNELLGLGQDVLADLVESFSELITKFPFSIPWDIAAILALLVAEPQAPVLEVPQYAYTGVTIQQVGAYRLDLSEWDSVMEVVRPMETILFAGWLAFKTDFFKGLLELTKG